MKLKQLPARSALSLIRFYKGAVSPYLPGACRFTPTCSEYAAQAIQRFGACSGGVMAAKRVLRCNPFCKGGYDPVPDPTRGGIR
ncbi:MAG: membrane protein insertion efficiency factor YidD [Clostridia bacterium]|nr:membrane protein insertion efficiency factor YidD [Clostridia bacterium]